MFNGIGSQVTIVEMLPNMLAPVDDEVRNLLVRSLSRRGITLATNAKVESFIIHRGKHVGQHFDNRDLGAYTIEHARQFDADHAATTQMILSGSFGNCQQVSLLIIAPINPRKWGMSGTEPVARMIFCALNCCGDPSLLVLSLLVTVTVREASTVPSPSNTSIRLPFINVPMPPVMRLTTLS